MHKTKWMLIALIGGLLSGAALNSMNQNQELLWISQNIFHPTGQIFLRMIFMIVVPMIFSALVLGVNELAQGHNVGSVARKTIIYTIIASSFSVLIGIGLVNYLKPGAGVVLNQEILIENASQITKIQNNAAQKQSIADTVINLFTKNPIDSAARALDGEIIALMIFALIFGLALAQYKNSRPQNSPELTLILFLQDVYEVSMRIVGFAMILAPFAIFAIVFNTAFRMGFDILQSLLFFTATVILGLLLQQIIVYSALLKFIAKRSPLDFYKKCREVYLYAFSTASSNATLPYSLKTAEEKLGIPKNISRFVLTVGSTANQNGTALFEGITVLFLAQVYGIDLSIAQQVQVVLMSILAGIGTAGVPGGSLPLIAILLQSVGIPAEGIGLILGVDRLLDMCRTTLNVSGDLVIAALVSPRENSPKS